MIVVLLLIIATLIAYVVYREGKVTSGIEDLSRTLVYVLYAFVRQNGPDKAATSITLEIARAPKAAIVAIELSKLAGLSEQAATSRDPELLRQALTRMFKKWASELDQYDKTHAS
jgi:hypothetical protein